MSYIYSPDPDLHSRPRVDYLADGYGSRYPSDSNAPISTGHGPFFYSGNVPATLASSTTEAGLWEHSDEHFDLQRQNTSYGRPVGVVSTPPPRSPVIRPPSPAPASPPSPIAGFVHPLGMPTTMPYALSANDSNEDIRGRINPPTQSYYPPGVPQPAVAGPTYQIDYDDDVRTRHPHHSRRSRSHREQPAVAGFVVQDGWDVDTTGIDSGERNSRSSPRPQSSNDGRRSIGSWRLSINSRDIYITSRKKNLRRLNRNNGYQFGEVLHDLLSASLVPLTENKRDPKDIRDQGVEFLSSFSSDDAIWEVRVSGLPYRQARVIHGLTDNSRDPSVGLRFLRFRFPFVRFEWHVETPYSELKELHAKKSVQIKFLWKAWTRSTGGSGLVAHGFCKDTIVVTKEGYPVIQERLFEVVNVILPEVMTPVPYLANSPELPMLDDLIIFSTSQTFVQTLRSSQRNMAFLVALSALVTSLKPIVDRFSTTSGWVLVGIGITAALISVMSVVLGWALSWIEANAAKHRQTSDNV